MPAMNREGDERLPAKRWVLLALSSAQRDGATDLVIGPAPQGGIAVRQKVQEVWQDWAPGGPSWDLVESELGGLAGIRASSRPAEGIIYLAYSGVRLRWHVRMSSPGGECALHNLGNATI